jgi:hypothetical protein
MQYEVRYVPGCIARCVIVPFRAAGRCLNPSHSVSLSARRNDNRQGRREPAGDSSSWLGYNFVSGNGIGPGRDVGDVAVGVIT